MALSQGLRTAEEQDAIYAKGRTAPGDIVTQAKGWESWHNYGLAVDIAFKKDKGQLFWPHEDSKLWVYLGDVGKMFGFEWGGDWKSFKDLPHFQMRPKTMGRPMIVKEAKQIAFEEGIENLWAMI